MRAALAALVGVGAAAARGRSRSWATCWSSAPTPRRCTGRSARGGAPAPGRPGRAWARRRRRSSRGRARRGSPPRARACRGRARGGRARAWRRWTVAGDWILVKASRGMRLERAVEALQRAVRMARSGRAHERPKPEPDAVSPLPGAARRVPGANVFRYVSTRVGLATLTSLLITFMVAPWFIRRARERQLGEVIRDDGPGQPRLEEGHADHGRRAHHPGAGGGDAAVVRPAQHAGLAGAAGHRRLRRHRLHRRLPQALAQEQEGPARAAQAAGPAGHRRRSPSSGCSRATRWRPSCACAWRRRWSTSTTTHSLALPLGALRRLRDLRRDRHRRTRSTSPTASTAWPSAR